MTLTRGKKILLIVVSALIAFLVVWNILGALVLQQDGGVGPVTTNVVHL
jgi:hypothetical protein